MYSPTTSLTDPLCTRPPATWPTKDHDETARSTTATANAIPGRHNNRTSLKLVFIRDHGIRVRGAYIGSIFNERPRPLPTKHSTVYRPFYGRPTITFRTLYRWYWLDTCVRIFDVQIYRLYNVEIYRNNTECKVTS